MFPSYSDISDVSQETQGYWQAESALRAKYRKYYDGTIFKEKIPLEVIRALRDVERIVRIEKQALNEKDQKLVRFYTLQIARLSGENG